jgi:hypothetical protein
MKWIIKWIWYVLIKKSYRVIVLLSASEINCIFVSDFFQFINFWSKILVLFLIFEEIFLLYKRFLNLWLVEIQNTKRELSTFHLMQ